MRRLLLILALAITAIACGNGVDQGDDPTQDKNSCTFGEIGHRFTNSSTGKTYECKLDGPTANKQHWVEVPNR